MSMLKSHERVTAGWLLLFTFAAVEATSPSMFCMPYSMSYALKEEQHFYGVCQGSGWFQPLHAWPPSCSGF